MEHAIQGAYAALSDRQLALLAAKIRLDELEMVFRADSGHIGGSLSATDVLTALYFTEMRIDPERPDWAERDRLVLSKGHCTPALYSVLARRGFFPREELSGFRRADSRLSGHAEYHVPGVDMSTGSLGQGFSAAVGMALANRSDQRAARVFALVGDGEMQEGQIWEAAMCAAHYRLGRLVLILDNNDLQIDGRVGDIMNVYPIEEKFRAFGWAVQTIDGHDFSQIRRALEGTRTAGDRPQCIVAKTIKGRGISFMEDDGKWHGETPNREEYERGRQELCRRIQELEQEVRGE
ncbi:MAG: transketolase [Ndongobacter sp.]|nr:transketolase [Ndongobacter sp.]